jgi:hypothetical protein
MGCKHRWQIEQTSADEAEGQCYNCGEIRTFRNRIDKSLNRWLDSPYHGELQFETDAQDHYVPWEGRRIDLSAYEGFPDREHRGYWYPAMAGCI